MATEQELLNAYRNDLKKRRSDVPASVLTPHQTVVPDNEFLMVGATEDGIIRNFTHIKGEFKSALDQMENRFLSQNRQLSDVQKQYQSEKESLEDLYKIRLTSESLSRLITALKQKEVDYQALLCKCQELADEIDIRRSKWRDEEQMLLNRIEELRDKDAVLTNKVASMERDLESELTKRYSALDAELSAKRTQFDEVYAQKELAFSLMESELEELRAKVAQFPEERSQLVESTKQMMEKQLINKHTHSVDMLKQAHQNDIKLSEQRSAMLDGVIAEKNSEIVKLESRVLQLEEKLSQSERQAQKLALEAVERVNQTASKPIGVQTYRFGQRQQAEAPPVEDNGYPRIVRSLRAS